MDEIVRVIAEDLPLSALAVYARDTAEEARVIHKTSPVCTAVLGRALAVVSLIGHQLKDTAASVTLRLEGGGPCGTVLTVADAQGCPRGYIQNPNVELPPKSKGKLNVGGAVGKNGNLTLIKDLTLGEPYVGTVRLVSGEIAEDLTAYFAVSEQVPTACGLGVSVNPDGSVGAAGGFFIQLMPGAGEDLAERTDAAVRRFESVTSFLAKNPDPLAMLQTILPDLSLKVLSRTPIRYHCSCTRSRVERSLVSMGPQEINDIIREQGSIDVGCQFCDRVYHFDRTQLTQLLQSSLDRNGTARREV